MFVAGWSFTNQCNLKCRHCYNASGKKHLDELTNEQAKEVARKLIDFKVDAVNFGGGECPLRDDFFEISEMLYNAGIKLSLTTNGLEYQRTMPHLHLFHDIGVSIDFADEQKHDYLRGKEGAYKSAIDAVKYYVSKGVDTEIVSCITKLNSSDEELRKMYDLAISLDVNYWRLNRYRPTGRKGDIDLLKLEPSDLMRAYSFLEKQIDKDFTIPDPLFNIFGKKSAPCPCGRTSFRIQPNGEVSPCVFLKLNGGNILDKSIEEILDSDIFRQIRNRDLSGTKCDSCNLAEKCKGGCAGAAYIENGTFNAPDPLCWHEPDWNVHEKYLCTAYVPIKGRKRC